MRSARAEDLHDTDGLRAAEGSRDADGEALPRDGDSRADSLVVTFDGHARGGQFSEADVLAPDNKSDMRIVLGDLPLTAAGRSRFTLAALASLVLHGALLAVLILRPVAEDMGGGGVTLDAVSVDIVSSDALESLRPSPDAAASGGAASADVAPPVPASAEAAPAKAAEQETAPEPPVVATREDAEVTAPPMTPPDAAKPEERKQPPEPDAATTNSAAAAAAVPNMASSPVLSAQSSSASEGSAGASPGQIARYAVEVRLALGRARPKHSGRRGKLVVTFEIGHDGAVARCDIAKSSGADSLDRATCATIAGLRFPEPPATMTVTQRTYSVPFEFK